MLDFGFSEILLTSAIALVVLGPERLPKVARQVGNWMGRARVMARQLSDQLEREVSAEELIRQQLKPPLKPDQPALVQPALVAPASAPTYPMPQPPVAVGVSAGEPAGAETAAPPAPRRLPDGHATTAAAMHPQPPATGAPATGAADPPPTVDQ
jgi:sec-independent protein translocase protein TatB